MVKEKTALTLRGFSDFITERDRTCPKVVIEAIWKHHPFGNFESEFFQKCKQASDFYRKLWGAFDYYYAAEWLKKHGLKIDQLFEALQDENYDDDYFYFDEDWFIVQRYAN